jgi:hypothetical protein
MANKKKKTSIYKMEYYIAWVKTTNEVHKILRKLHEGFGGGHLATNIIVKNILDVGYWWPTLFHDVFEFYRSCDACQRARGLATQSLDKLIIILPKEPSMKWRLDFVEPIKLVG